jgi:hypothetical protein
MRAEHRAARRFDRSRGARASSILQVTGAACVMAPSTRWRGSLRVNFNSPTTIATGDRPGTTIAQPPAGC